MTGETGETGGSMVGTGQVTGGVRWSGGQVAVLHVKQCRSGGQVGSGGSGGQVSQVGSGRVRRLDGQDRRERGESGQSGGGTCANSHFWHVPMQKACQTKLRTVK